MLGIGIGIGRRRPVLVEGGGGGGGDPKTVNAVKFDGTNDSLTRGAQLTGAADGENLLFSAWFNFKGGDDAVLQFLAGSTNRIQVFRRASNEIQITFKSSNPTTLYNGQTVNKFNTVINGGWRHLLIAAQLDVTPIVQIFVDDAVQTQTVFTAPVNGDIDWTEADFAVGATTGAANKLNSDLAEVYLTNEFLDISVESNRRKFITALGKPVELGADGSTPTGTAPLVFLEGPTVSWHTNDGSGGGFTENGALTDGASSPSD